MRSRCPNVNVVGQTPPVGVIAVTASAVALAAVVSVSLAIGAQAGQPAGKAPYDRVCRVCHGAEAQGDAAPRLVPIEMEYEELLAKVREGGSEMPPISTSTVSDDEVKQILDYLKTLGATPPPARASSLGIVTAERPEVARTQHRSRIGSLH
jgi:mono/diheme cytochrome c family protein